MTLLELARQFDSLPADDIDARLSVAEKMNVMLGDRREEFDAIFSSFAEVEPQTSAEMTLRDMGLAE